MTTNPWLFHDSLADALRECVQACGGHKAVGVLLWPEKAADVAGRLLSDCLNDAKRERLSPEQVLLLLRLARERGCHAAMHFIARDAGYSDPQPLEPEDERAKLQREFIEASRHFTRLAAQMERLNAVAAAAGPTLRSAA